MKKQTNERAGERTLLRRQSPRALCGERARIRLAETTTEHMKKNIIIYLLESGIFQWFFFSLRIVCLL